jgi:hypothetical protein
MVYFQKPDNVIDSVMSEYNKPFLRPTPKGCIEIRNAMADTSESVPSDAGSVH